ncbi:lysine transporter LysE [Jannaschia pagri]|uniref:Lysine transporter LysE n=1 Tax=Jannaschia pagri TaxID=2829797 RepID=A0ABQ4NKB9_9RHOB|nr:MULTISPECIES: LysE family translocator [unclassified Jannaschia]GIT90710.1 lysine transporter LysE [Jannaschia sp. AI_61]GIT94542.1 lysine transporter LysE [Jannaschia sp. AI_62]
MTLETLLSFALIASLLVISPGPNGVLVAKTVPNSGRAAGFANVAGFIAAFYLHGALAILGLSVLLAQSAWAFTALKLAGAAYLTWIGLRALWSVWADTGPTPSVPPAKRRRDLLTAFTEGFLTNALNPKVAIFYLAAFPQFIPDAATHALPALILVTLHAAINALWFAAMVLALGTMTQAARAPRVQRWIRGLTGVIFVGFGLRLATTRL